jgi:methionyl-tRNA formyltransferase
MKYIFFGTPQFAAIILEKLIEAGFVPEAVVCNPDEPIGRKKIITPPLTKIIAQTNKIPVWQPGKLEIRNWKLEIDKLGNIDFAIVVAYNKIIPQTILDTLPAKFIGVHPSLLPKYRGPSPIQSAILNGEKETGTDLFLIDKDVDHGPVLASAKCKISEKDNYETLEKKLAELGGKLLIENLPKYLSGKIKPQEQDHLKATFTKKFSTEDGCVDLEKDSPELIFNKIRALNPDPGVFTFIQTKNGKKRVKLLEAKLNPTHTDVYGTKDETLRQGLRLSSAECPQDKLELLKVQPEGKKPMSFKDFQNGNT